ncbi:MAG: hypothetical protein A2583_12600 [Bdellovibrionales bacterium RIFOXYD1_FULL_53_11]|nr:MAG: hypothetical protein A2583_12600 [Bdellovibrionales bacterium RIFOXYD1_FULL_53_11]
MKKSDLAQVAVTAMLAVFLTGATARESNLISLGPALSFPAEDEISVWWQSSADTKKHFVEYGMTPELGNTLAHAAATDTPFVTLSGLEPDRLYYYRVTSDNNQSAVRSFRTLKKKQDIDFLRVGIWADNQHGKEIFRKFTIPALKRAAPDFLMAIGDEVQNGDKPADWREQLYIPAARLLDTLAWLPVRGNHDGESSLARKMMPLKNNVQWYSFSAGPLYIVVLDTNLDYSPGSAQYKWFIGQTRSEAWTSAAFRVVAFHHPPWTNLWDNANYSGEKNVRAHLVPAIENAGTDVVLNGHAHCYEHAVRKTRTGITHYFIVGGGGGALDRVRTANWPDIVKEKSSYHIAVMDVSRSRLKLSITDTVSGSLIDEIQIP